MPGRAFRIFLAFLALAVFWTWPLASHLSSRIPHDPGDPVLNTWLLWWNAHAVPFTSRWWNPPIFFPMRGALALSEHLAGIGVIVTPLQLLHASALAAYNIALILSFTLSGFFTFLLVRHLLRATTGTPRTLGAFAAALAYGFGPYRAGQLAHLQVLTSQWMPLALFAMHAYVDDGQRRWLALFAIAWLLQALSNGYYLLFFPVLIAVWLIWFIDWRHRPSRGTALAMVWAGSSLLLLPVLLRYAAVQRSLGLVRTAGEMALFSARPESFLNASGMLTFWRSNPTLTTEEFLFPGITPILLTLATLTVLVFSKQRVPLSAGGRAPLQSTFIFYFVAALLMWGFAFGPGTRGSSLAWLHPYTFLTYVPGFDGLRVPARFAMLATLCISIAAGVGSALIAPREVKAFTALAACVVMGLLADGWPHSMPLAIPPGRVILPDVPQAAVLELPAGEGSVDVAAMYRQTQHGRPLINGYSGHMPPHYVIFSLALRRGDPSAIMELARGRPLIISVNQFFDADGAMERLVRGLPGIESHGVSSAGALFVLPAVPAARVAPSGDLWPSSMRETGRDTIELDFGVPRVVRTIAFPVRWHYRELDPRIAIQGSMDGVTWSTLWEDWTGGPTVAAALNDPLEVPVRVPLPDISVRYLRLHPVGAWMRREVRAFGPK
jgi:hypothetical protein